MIPSDKVDAFIEEQGEWTELLKQLRTLLLETELEETVKWGIPTYCLKGKNVLGMGAFKSYAGLWFFQGVFLKDEAGVLINAQEGKTKGLRQWRFYKNDDLKEGLVRDYITEAIQNQKDGKEIKPRSNKKTVIPPELKERLENDPGLKKQFDGLSRGKRSEYAEYIASAKQASTKERRLQKIIPMILDGLGLSDKYR